MTTETKPIIDPSEWEECTPDEFHCAARGDRMYLYIGGVSYTHYFRRKPKPVKSLEEKIKTFMRSCCAFSEGQASDLLDIARIIEEHLNSKEDK